jgi:hypothetical protein
MLNILKIPRPGTDRGEAVKAARDNEALAEQDNAAQKICEIIAALPQFGGNYAKAVKFYRWMRHPTDWKTKRNGPYIDPARYPEHPALRSFQIPAF